MGAAFGALTGGQTWPAPSRGTHARPEHALDIVYMVMYLCQASQPILRATGGAASGRSWAGGLPGCCCRRRRAGLRGGTATRRVRRSATAANHARGQRERSLAQRGRQGEDVQWRRGRRAAPLGPRSTVCPRSATLRAQCHHQRFRWLTMLDTPPMRDLRYRAHEALTALGALPPGSPTRIPPKNCQSIEGTWRRGHG